MEYKNLRPISNLQFVSKITERAASDQIYNYILANNVFPLLQSAYRKHHSTETALPKVINDIHVNINNQQVMLLVFLDLSSAFDTVDHNILINRMQTASFGITDTQWRRQGGARGGSRPPNILQSGFLDSSKSDVVGGGGGVRCVNIWLSSVRLRVMANA